MILTKLGFELTDFKIEKTDFDDDTKARIDKIADKTAKAQVVSAMGQVNPYGMPNYAAIEQLAALHDAAKNDGGIVGLGVGIGVGVGLGQSLGGPFPFPFSSRSNLNRCHRQAQIASSATPSYLKELSSALAAGLQFRPNRFARRVQNR